MQKQVRESLDLVTFSGAFMGQTELSMPLVAQKDISWCLLNIKSSRTETKTWPVDQENFQIDKLICREILKSAEHHGFEKTISEQSKCVFHLL